MSRDPALHGDRAARTATQRRDAADVPAETSCSSTARSCPTVPSNIGPRTTPNYDQPRRSRASSPTPPPASASSPASAPRRSRSTSAPSSTPSTCASRTRRRSRGPPAAAGADRRRGRERLREPVRRRTPSAASTSTRSRSRCRSRRLTQRRPGARRTANGMIGVYASTLAPGAHRPRGAPGSRATKPPLLAGQRSDFRAGLAHGQPARERADHPDRPEGPLERHRARGRGAVPRRLPQPRRRRRARARLRRAGAADAARRRRRRAAHVRRAGPEHRDDSPSCCAST